ncbi:hypothetical protein SAMN05216559_1259 [Halomicrobium zhouii]|uniref:Uncharacterized protein n=1 Tax=Halomicrobium zhouii TaxID=767519 RepID=A0A1I6KQ19_9EURY|nr:hypothetical protein [Halomicrobium zhouii]SFR93277.1 hypothetical protein SAMN05216559_1259 [Halomicrobium zhouii]
MPNGKPGDRPDTDVIVHGIDVYDDQEINEMIREIDRRTEGFYEHTEIDLYSDWESEFSGEETQLKESLVEILDNLDESGG